MQHPNKPSDGSCFDELVKSRINHYFDNMWFNEIRDAVYNKAGLPIFILDPGVHDFARITETIDNVISNTTNMYDRVVLETIDAIVPGVVRVIVVVGNTDIPYYTDVKIMFWHRTGQTALTYKRPKEPAEYTDMQQHCIAATLHAAAGHAECDLSIGCPNCGDDCPLPPTTDESIPITTDHVGAIAEALADLVVDKLKTTPSAVVSDMLKLMGWKPSPVVENGEVTSPENYGAVLDAIYNTGYSLSSFKADSATADLEFTDGVGKKLTLKLTK